MHRLLHPRLSLRAATLALLAAGSVAVAAVARADAPAAPAAATTTTAPVNQVIQWNRVLIGILNTPGAQPATIQPTRSLAILHAAIYDAVDSIKHTAAPYLISIKAPRLASPDAAAAAAGYTVLSSLYPAQQETLGAQFTSSLAQVPNGYHKAEGVRLGEAVANGLLSLRSDDGSSLPQPIFTPGTQPGGYQLTAPAFAQPAFTQGPSVRPFVLKRASQFRPGPPPALTSS